VAQAWLVHLFTASGLILAFLAAASIFEHDYRAGFFFLALQVLVDAVDGILARRARVSERIPWFDGAKLDDITDYLAYVFVPALFVWRALIVPDGWELPDAAAMLLSSAYGFNRTDAKTSDHFFTGFPSYWNIVAFYLWIAGWSPQVNAAILLVLAVLVFVPFRWVYPSRTPTLMTLTNVLGAVWTVLLLLMLWRHPDISRPLFLASLAFPIYYAGLSAWLNSSRNRQKHA
jgi:phosphatidylcholine synthase